MSKFQAEAILRQFVSVFTPVTDDALPPVCNRCLNALESITVTEEGVLKLLQSINVNKAIGPDKIPNQVLKECAEEFAPAVRCLFQLSLDSCTLPDGWTNANVSSIFKKRQTQGRKLPSSVSDVSHL